MYKNVRKPLFLLENVLDLLKKTKKCLLHEFKLLFIWNMGYKRHVRFTLLQNTF